MNLQEKMNQVRYQVRDQVGYQVRDQVWVQLRDYVRRLRDQIEQQIQEELK
jgi:hypothetical protein